MQEEEADAVLTEQRHPEEVSLLIDFNIDQILQNDKYYKRY